MGRSRLDSGRGIKMASTEEGELQDSNSSSEEEEDNEKKQTSSVLKFKNDGSFLEMFKKMQEQNKDSKESKAPVPEANEKVSVKSEPSSNSSATSETKKEIPQKKSGLLSMVGKRRGGRVLPTGVVKKLRRPDEEDDNEKKDAWSQYMSEVRKYKERLGDEEEKNRPLVK